MALGSPVPEVMKGSGAGIEKLRTYRQMAKLRAKEEVGGEKVILVVDEEESRKIQIDKQYL